MKGRSFASAHALALAAIALWASLALLSVELTRIPPLELIGAALLLGSLPTLPKARAWRVPATTLLLGIYGLFGYHFCLFLALRYAPAMEANLLNYLWPLLLVVLAPLFLRGARLTRPHVLGALLGFAGALLLMAFGERGATLSRTSLLGDALAVLAAFMWSSYSLLTKRVAPFPTAAVGGFAAVSGVLALLAHAAFEPTVTPTFREGCWLALLGLGPMGVAFLFWDAAMKRGDAASIGTLAYLTPLLSTLLLATASRGAVDARIGAALLLILAGAWLGGRSRAPLSGTGS